MNAGKPQQMADQYRQQDRRQRVGGGNQRLEQRHDRLRQQQAKLVLHQQAERIQRDHHRQDRDQQIERLLDFGRHLLRQRNADIAHFKETDQLGGVDRHQNGGEDPHAAQRSGRQHLLGLWRGDQ
ncbi:hypothetical protein D3C79_521420 [compost metagenome]